MRKIFTLQFLINFINPDKTFNQFSADAGSIDEVIFAAPDHCVENIMNFARSYRVADTKSTGKIELILN